MKPKTVFRNYSGNDALMCGSARTTYGLFILGMAEFTAFDSTLDAAYALEYFSDLTKAETVVRDYVVRSRQMTKTENALSVLDVARAKYNEIKYFAQKTFRDSAATLIEFGFEDYAKARRNQIMMSELLTVMHAACQKYAVPLIASGYSQAAIDAILPLREELIQKNTGQKMAQKERPKLTEDRIILLNNCYSGMMTLMAAAQLVYATDYAKQQQFVYRTKGPQTQNELP
ncbi:MAG TPA: hypothetical protein VK476_06430 [Flavobacterium sp.]|nr:hypothetical protein [Flavobacterium sp.]